MTATATTPLEKHRSRAAAAHDAAQQAQAGVAELDQRLKNNVELTKQQQVSLRNLEAETLRLKRLLKNSAKEKSQLAKQRAKAVGRAKRATVKASAAEAKYDKAVLADLVRREKQRDRETAAPATPPVQTTTPVDTAATPAEKVPAEKAPAEKAPAARATTAKATAAKATAAKATPPAGKTASAPARRAASADPAPEKPAAGTTTAVRTAARKTAANAGTTRTPRSRAGTTTQR